MDWNPHITVAAIIESNGRFLFVEEQVQGQLMLNQPAGHLEPDETLSQAVIRETFEETAWQFEPEYLVGIYHWQHPVYKETFIRFCFAGEIKGHDQNASLDPDIIQPVWLSYDELVARKYEHRSPLVLQCLDDYRAGYRHDINLIQHIL